MWRRRIHAELGGACGNLTFPHLHRYLLITRIVRMRVKWRTISSGHHDWNWICTKGTHLNGEQKIWEKEFEKQKWRSWIYGSCGIYFPLTGWWWTEMSVGIRIRNALVINAGIDWSSSVLVKMSTTWGFGLNFTDSVPRIASQVLYRQFAVDRDPILENFVHNCTNDKWSQKVK